MADPAWLQQYDRDLAPLLESYRAQAAQKPQGIFANVDPVMLGLAQGFLSPTKTGGFGESIGLGLAGAQGPLESMRKRQMDAQNKILELQAARAKMAMEAPYWERRGLTGTDGSLSAAQNRLYLEGKINMIENAMGDPEALARLGYSSDEEANAALSEFQKAYLGYGSTPSKAAKGQAKTEGTVEGSLKPMTSDVKSKAQDAIKRGAPKSAVIQRLKEQGYSAEGLE